LLNNVIGKT